MPFLTVENLVVNYGAIKAVQGISLHVEEGEVITLLGANGAGKSSIINALVHLVEPAAGTITFRDTDITRLSTAAIVKIGVSQSMEGRQVFPRMSVMSLAQAQGQDLGLSSTGQIPELTAGISHQTKSSGFAFVKAFAGVGNKIIHNSSSLNFHCLRSIDVSQRL